MRFSIIIPVYNVEQYIGKCMETVMNQTFRDYEVIVVDDESPDGSMDIVQKYSDAYPGMIRIIHQKNTRQGGARNNGVQHARGEYLLFVDSDDYVAPDMLERVAARLEQQPCDILLFRYAQVTEQGKLLPTEVHDGLGPGVYSPRQNREVVFLATGPVCKAFRRAFYLETGIQFPKHLLYEDSITRLFYAMAESIVVCDDVLYYYVQSSNSSIRRGVSIQMLDILTMTNVTLDAFQSRGLYEPFREPLDCALIYGILYILDRISEEKPDHGLLLPMADYIREHFPDYGSNPYIGKTLRRALDYLCAHQFWKYHIRILVAGRWKEALLRLPPVEKLRQLRRS